MSYYLFQESGNGAQSRSRLTLAGLPYAAVLVAALFFITAVNSQAQVICPEFDEPQIVAELSEPGLDEGGMWVSPDGLRIYFCRDLIAGGGIREEIYMAARPSVDQPFGQPAVVQGLGSSSYKDMPWLSPDEKTIYFRASIPGTDATIFRAQRNSIDEPFSNLESLDYLRTAVSEVRAYSPSLTNDELVIVFAGDEGLYQANRDSKFGQFGVPLLLTALGSSYFDGFPSISANGLDVYFISSRPGGPVGRNLWYSSRESLAGTFGAPVPVQTVNGAGEEWTPFFSASENALYYASRTSGVPGSADIYKAIVKDTVPTPTPPPVLEAPKFAEAYRLDGVNSPNLDESCPWLSPDGRRLYFSRDSISGSGVNSEIYFSERNSTSESFGAPQLVTGLGNLTIQWGRQTKNDLWLTPDEKVIYFRGSVPSVNSDGAIYRAERAQIGAPFENLQLLYYINEALDGMIHAPSLHVNQLLLFFGSKESIFFGTRSNVADNFDNFTEASNLNTPSNEDYPIISSDGLQIFFRSDRPDGKGGMDVWYSRRASLQEDFPAPVSVETINTSQYEGRAFLHEPTGFLYFSRGSAAGSYDLYVAPPEGAYPTPTPTPNPLNITLAAHIEPPAPITTDDLECVTQVTNPDSVPIDLSYSWFRNGSELLNDMTVDGQIYTVTGPTLSEYFTTRNETFYCSVEATDGVQSIIVNTAPVTIQNAPPSAPVVEIRPAEPMPGQDLGINILVYSVDPDGDAVDYRIDWYESEDGGITWVHKREFKDHAFISGIYIQQGDLWRVVVTPFEVPGASAKAGTATVEGEGGWDQVFIGQNRRPVVTVSYPDANDTIAAPDALIKWTATDADGDPVRVELYYDRDGIKGGGLLIATDLPAAGSLNWTPPGVGAGAANGDLSGDGDVTYQDLFFLTGEWQDPATGRGYRIFARAFDSNNAIGEAFSPGEVIAPKAFPAATPGLMQLLGQWHAGK